MEGQVIGHELRAIALGNLASPDAVYGLSCFSPMINILRDPFWGRNSEVNTLEGEKKGKRGHLFNSF
jgi:beta-glucosidase-like glycosyl hydrolase